MVSFTEFLMVNTTAEFRRFHEGTVFDEFNKGSEEVDVVMPFVGYLSHAVVYEK